jgi:hypothetical protein
MGGRGGSTVPLSGSWAASAQALTTCQYLSRSRPKSRRRVAKLPRPSEVDWGQRVCPGSAPSGSGYRRSSDRGWSSDRPRLCHSGARPSHISRTPRAIFERIIGTFRVHLGERRADSGQQWLQLMIAFPCSRGVLDAFAWGFHFCGVGRCLPGLRDGRSIDLLLRRGMLLIGVEGNRRDRLQR